MRSSDAIGNAAVARLVHPVVDEKAGEGEFGGMVVADEGPGADVEAAADGLGEEVEDEEEVAEPAQVALHTDHAHGSAEIGQGEENEFGELTGELGTGVPVCLFIDGGKVGEGLVGWAGGTGGKGLQNVGDVELRDVAVYVSESDSVRLAVLTRGATSDYRAAAEAHENPLVRATVDGRQPNLAGFHVFTFNDLERTERWRQEHLARVVGDERR